MKKASFRPLGISRRALAAACAALGLSLGSAAWAQTSTATPQTSFGQTAVNAASADAWRFSLTPYVWLPTINANINYPINGLPGGGVGGGFLDGIIDTEIGPNKYLTKLNFALMLNAEARRGPWSVMGDFIGIKASGLVSTVTGFRPNVGLLPEGALGATVSAGTETEISTSLFTVMGGYQMIATPSLDMDLAAGVRTGRLSASMDWTLSGELFLPDGTQALARTGSAKGSKNPVDGIVGVKGRYRINENWSVPFHFDVGAGTSDLTWQGFAGLSYAFGWGNVVVAYRHLYLENSDREIFKKYSLSGPMIGATWRF